MSHKPALDLMTRKKKSKEKTMIYAREGKMVVTRRKHDKDTGSVSLPVRE